MKWRTGKHWGISVTQIKALIFYVFHPKGKHGKILDIEKCLALWRSEKITHFLVGFHTYVSADVDV